MHNSDIAKAGTEDVEKPSKDFVDRHGKVLEIGAELEIDGNRVQATISQTEAGDLEVDVNNPSSIDSDKRHYDEVKGVTQAGSKLILKNVFVRPAPLSVTLVSGLTIDESGGYEFASNSATCELDVIGFRYTKNPDFFDPEDEIKLLTQTDYNAGGDNYVDWKAKIVPLPNYPRRVRSIKNYNNIVRTAKLLFEVEGIYGTPKRVREFVVETVDKILTSMAVVQGTIPIVTNLSFDHIDGTSISEIDRFDSYIWARNASASLGGCGRRSHLLVMGSDRISDYLSYAFPKYEGLKEELRLRKVLGYYSSSLTPNHSGESKMMDLCTAIELLASRYTPEMEREEEFELLVNDLEIDVSELIPERGSYSTDADDLVEEYFWFQSRNYVAHGDSSMQNEELLYDFETLLVLFRKIILKILLPDDQDPKQLGIYVGDPRDIATPE